MDNTHFHVTLNAVFYITLQFQPAVCITRSLSLPYNYYLAYFKKQVISIMMHHYQKTYLEIVQYFTCKQIINKYYHQFEYIIRDIKWCGSGVSFTLDHFFEVQIWMRENVWYKRNIDKATLYNRCVTEINTIHSAVMWTLLHLVIISNGYAKLTVSYFSDNTRRRYEIHCKHSGDILNQIKYIPHVNKINFNNI